MPDILDETLSKIAYGEKAGGNFGHAGRPGKRGGSAPRTGGARAAKPVKKRRILGAALGAVQGAITAGPAGAVVGAVAGAAAGARKTGKFARKINVGTRKVAGKIGRGVVKIATGSTPEEIRKDKRKLLINKAGIKKIEELKKKLKKKKKEIDDDISTTMLTLELDDDALVELMENYDLEDAE